MKRRGLAVILPAALALVWTTAAQAEERDAGEAGEAAVFQLSFWDSAQVVDSNRSVHGFRLTLPYGRNRDLVGLDLGIVPRLDGDLWGAQFGIVGLVDGEFAGLQNNWAFGWVGGRVRGVQSNLVNVAGSVWGVQGGAVNYATVDAVGARAAFVNVSGVRTVGAELGLVNYAPQVEGVQIGLVNVTEHLKGVQVGLVNVASNGFLPVFVLVNAAL